MKPRLRYQDLVDQQRAGSMHGIFVDDTGSPGLEHTPPHLHPDRKSWVAVAVPKQQIGEVWRQFPRALSQLEGLLGTTEFHFTDIYMRRREFRDVPLATRLGVFRFMAHIFATYRFPVFVQTLDPGSLNDIRTRADFPERLGPFTLKKHEDLALFFLLLRVKWHLEQTYSGSDTLARVFVDEGFKKSGTAVSVPSFKTVFADGLICFARSDSILPLQLADFAAFCLNRTQLLMGKKKLSELDVSLLRIIQPLAWNYQNFPVVLLDELFSTDGSRLQ